MGIDSDRKVINSSPDNVFLLETCSEFDQNQRDLKQTVHALHDRRFMSDLLKPEQSPNMALECLCRRRVDVAKICPHI